MSHANKHSRVKAQDLPKSSGVNWTMLYRNWLQLKNLLNIGRVGVLIASLMYIGPYCCAYFPFNLLKALVTPFCL